MKENLEKKGSIYFSASRTSKAKYWEVNQKFKLNCLLCMNKDVENDLVFLFKNQNHPEELWNIMILTTR